MSCVAFRSRPFKMGVMDDTNQFKDVAFDLHHPVGDLFYQASFEMKDPTSLPEFKVKVKDATVPHSTVFQNLLSMVDETTQAKINAVDPILQKTVMQTLQSVLPLSSS